MEDKCLMILEFVAEGRLTVDEAVVLITALRGASRAECRAENPLSALQIEIHLN